MAALPLKPGETWYLSDLNQHIQATCDPLQTRPGPSSGTPFSITPPSNAIWSWAEKSVFFQALSRHSRWRPDLIARDIGSKTEAEVIWFLQQLVHNEARLRSKNKAKGRKRSHLHGFAAAAYEMSDKWIEQEEAIARSLDEAERNWARADQLLRQEKEVEGALAVRKVNRDPSKSYTAKELKFQERRARAERAQACVALVKQQMRTEWLEEMTAARLNVVNELLEAHWKPPSETEVASLPFTDLPTGDVRERRIAEDTRILKALREMPNRTAEQQAEFRRLSEGARKRTAARYKKLLDIGHTEREIEETGGVDVVYCRMQREDRIERGVLCETNTQDTQIQEASTPTPKSPSKREQRANHFAQISDNMTRAHKAAYLRAAEKERDDMRAWLQSEQSADGLIHEADAPKVKALSTWLPEAKAARAERLGKVREMGLETKILGEKFDLLNFAALARAVSVPAEESGLPSGLSFGLISSLTAFLEAFVARLVFEVLEFTEARLAVLGESSEDVDAIDVEDTIRGLGLPAGLDWQELEPKWTSHIRRKKVGGDAVENLNASPNPESPDSVDVMGVFPCTLPLVTGPYTSEDLDVLAEDPVQSILADDDHADVEDAQEAYDVALDSAYEEAMWEALKTDEASDVALQIEDRLQNAEETREQVTLVEQDERQQLYCDLLERRRDYVRACTEWDRSENRRQNKLRKRAESEKLGLYDTQQARNKKKRRLNVDVQMVQMMDEGLLDSSDDEDPVQSRDSTASGTSSSASDVVDVVDD